MTKTEVHEGQVMNLTDKAGNQTVLPLTEKNAHRVTMIRRKGTDEGPVPFHFKKKHLGIHSYAHLHGNPESNIELHSTDFKDWEAVAFKHPGYLEEYWAQAYDAYRWSSFDPDVHGETEIVQFEELLHEDLQQIPEEKREDYTNAYKQKFSILLSSLSRCANPMVTGSARFNYSKSEKADNAYQNKYNEFQEWRERYLNAMKRIAEAARPEEEKQEEAWQGLKRQIKSSADTIHEIDTGKARGYARALFVSSIQNKVGTLANRGEVEIVQKAIDFMTEYNSNVKKPIITARNKFFQLPEVARRMREKLQIVKGQENKDVEFDGGKMVWNYGEDRLQILFNDIPDESKRKELKSSGFRWSPRFKAWQRQLTSNAIYAARRVLNLQNS